MSDTRIPKLLPALSACLCILSAGCGGGDSSTDATYTVGGTVSGVTAGSSSLVLSNNGGDIVDIPADGSFTFGTALAYGTGYNVTILDNPSGEICSITGVPSGIIILSSVNNMAFVCSPTTAIVTTFAGFANVTGTADGPASNAYFNYPVDVASDRAGNLYVSDSANRTIRKISTIGIVTTLAGTPGVIGSADGTGAAASFSLPTGLTVDSSGNVYVADTGNNTIRKITPTGVVTTVAGTAGVAGAVDATGTAATFNLPASVAVDTNGNLFVTDRGNDTIRKIDSGGVVSTFAGFAGVAGATDGVGSTALFDAPLGIAIDASNNLYVSDGSNTIRKIDPNANVVTGAGAAGVAGAADGMGTAATFRSLAGIAVDAAGNIYVADEGNDTIRKIAPDTTVSTVAGLVGSIGTSNGNAGAATFNNPTGITVDSAGNLYVADYNNQLIRKIAP